MCTRVFAASRLERREVRLQLVIRCDQDDIPLLHKLPVPGDDLLDKAGFRRAHDLFLQRLAHGLGVMLTGKG